MATAVQRCAPNRLMVVMDVADPVGIDQFDLLVFDDTEDLDVERVDKLDLQGLEGSADQALDAQRFHRGFAFGQLYRRAKTLTR